jgi:hypothetical protein
VSSREELYTQKVAHFLHKTGAFTVPRNNGIPDKLRYLTVIKIQTATLSVFSRAQKHKALSVGLTKSIAAPTQRNSLAALG